MKVKKLTTESGVENAEAHNYDPSMPYVSGTGETFRRKLSRHNKNMLSTR